MDLTTVKALGALEWLCRRDSPTGVTEMSISLGMVKSNAHRVLTTLEALGYAVALHDGRYAATLKTWEVGSAVLDRLDVNAVARPVMEALSEVSNETVHLSVLDGVDVVYIDKVECRQPVRAVSRIGGRAPAHTVATGKALLASVNGIEALLPKKLKDSTPASIRDRTELIKELEGVRHKGFAISRGEYREGVCGVAAAIRNERGEVVAAIGISGPSSRLTSTRLNSLGPHVIEAARQISCALGYRPAKPMDLPATDGKPSVKRRPRAKALA